MPKLQKISFTNVISHSSVVLDHHSCRRDDDFTQ